MKAALVQQAAPTGTGTLQFTSSKFSGDVKAGIFFCTRATANDTVTADSVIGIGFTDGTTEGWVGFGADDAVATADFNNRQLTAQTAGRTEGSTTTSRIVGTVSGQSHPSTGYQLNFTTVDDATLIKALLLGGSDISADVVAASFTNAASPETVVVNHGLAAAPTHILCISACNPAGGAATRNRSSFGIHDVAGNTYAMHVVDASGTTTSVSRSYIGTDCIAARQGTSASPDYKVTITSVGSSSFSMVSTGGSTHTDQMIFLALRIPNYEGALSIVDIPTSGTVALASALTTRPILALNVFSRRTTTGTVTTGQTGGAFGLGVAVDTEGNFSAATSTQTQGPVTTVVEKSRISNTESITVMDDTGAVDVQGTVTFSATGATAGFTNFPASALKMVSWVVTPPAGIRLRAVGTEASANASSVQPGAPAGQQAGDLMELVLGVQTSDETCMSGGISGWVEAGHLDGSFRQLYKYVRVATGAGEAMPTIAPTGLAAGNTVIAQVAAYAPPAGASFDISTVIADAALSTTSTATGAFTIPFAARTVAEDNRLVSISWCFNGQSSAQSLLSGFTQSQYASTSAGTDMSIGGQYRTQSSKADISSGTITITAGADQTDSSLVITYQTHPTGSADTWSARQTGAPSGAVTIQTGSNRRFVIAVGWNSEVGVNHSATLAVGGVEGTKLSLAGGGPNYTGIDLWTWDETAIALMSGSTITTPSGSYPSTTSWAYNTITSVGSLTAPGYEVGTGTSISIASPYGQAADKALIVACSNATSGTYDPNPANGTGYTEIIDGLTSGGAPHFGLFTRSNTDAHGSTNSTLTQSVSSTRFLAVHLGFNAAAATVTITDVSEIANGGTFTITGTGLNQIATVELIDDQGHRVAQTKDSQNDTTIVCTLTRGTLRYTSGSGAELVVTTALGVEVTADVDIVPQSGWSFTNVIQLAASTDRVETGGTDLAVGDQVAAEVESGLRPDGGVDSIDEAVTDFDAEVHDGTGWGTTGTITRANLTTSVIVPDVSSDHPTFAAAEAELIAASLTAFQAAQAYSLTIAVGLVIDQSPPAGTSVETGSAVSLITSLGPPGTGTLATLFLGSSESVPSNAVFLAGTAYSQNGARYVALWPADDVVVYRGPFAHRPDGALIIALSGTTAATPQGVAVTARGEVLATPNDASFTHNKWTLRGDGYLCMTEIS